MEQFSNEYIELLARKYKEGTLSEKEKTDFKSWYSDLSTNSDLDDDVNSFKLHDDIKSKIDYRLNINRGDSKTSFQPWKLGVAATAFLLVVGSVLLILNRLDSHAKANKEIILAKADALPGRNLAYLTLANGKTVNLDTAKAGQAVALNGPQKSQNDQLVYSSAPNDNIAEANLLNTLVTPAGGQYKVVLSDGTKVWLDAESKLIYPQRFDDTVRRVTLIGQAYFEVAHENNRPFKVNAGLQQITVLGTHFNINAYKDEPRVITTLVQGLVRVSCGNQRIVIRPGEQAVSDSAKKDLQIKSAHVNTDIAWTNGMIEFQDASLPIIMRQVARWYNVKIRYVGNQSKDIFSGGFSRNSNLVSLLDILKSNNIPYVMKQDGNDKILEIGKL